jgi:hypothetical protein
MTTPIDPMAAVKMLRDALQNLRQNFHLHYGPSCTRADEALTATAQVEAPTSEPVGMSTEQEPKYGIRNNRLFNRASGEFIPDDEPVFIFRARDWHTKPTIAYYMGRFCAGEHRVAIEGRVHQFGRFSADHSDRMKEPDTVAAPQAAHVTQISKCSVCNGAGHVEIEQARPECSVEQFDVMRNALVIQIDELIDIASRHAWGRDDEEIKRTEGAIDYARKVAKPYRYNGPTPAAVSPAKPDLSGLIATIKEMRPPNTLIRFSDSYIEGFVTARDQAAALLATHPVAQAKPDARESFDFHAHLARQAAFSLKTFGPGPRTVGVCDHIRKELLEIEADPLDLGEWVDVVILALDGAWRCGGSPDQIIDGIVAKQTKNEGRNWPDWRSADPNKAIEHDRSGEVFPVAATTTNTGGPQP